jgi:hypothetical protein
MYFGIYLVHFLQGLIKVNRGSTSFVPLSYQEDASEQISH